MFTITQQYIGGQVRHAVVGDIGHQTLTVLATNEMQACEIARALNESAGVELEDVLETVPAEELHPTLPGLLTARGFDYAELRDSAPEMTPEEQLAEAQLRG